MSTEPTVVFIVLPDRELALSYIHARDTEYIPKNVNPGWIVFTESEMAASTITPGSPAGVFAVVLEDVENDVEWLGSAFSIPENLDEGGDPVALEKKIGFLKVRSRLYSLVAQ